MERKKKGEEERTEVKRINEKKRIKIKKGIKRAGQKARA
jgi:hypothetical protein